MKTIKWRRWIGILASLFILTTALLWLIWDLPSPDHLEHYTSTASSIVYDRYGRILFEFPPPYTGSHTPVQIAEIPMTLQQATIAIEDRSFYDNPGFDIAGIVRALVYNLTGEDYVMGGSTITQQLVRNLLFEPGERNELTFRRKMRELMLAISITQRYTKGQILEFYLNETYYGNMAYGVEAAAQSYYGKHVRDLDLAESAMLALLPQGPALWNPLENLPEAKLRQAIILDRMIEEGFITGEQAALAKGEVLYFAATRFPIRAPHYVMFVRRYLEQELGLSLLQSGGLQIHTTLDIDLSETVRDMMRYRLSLLATCFHQAECPPGGYNVRNAAVLVMDPDTGAILAMVGSPDYFSAEISGAVNGTTALRQPGSAIKPITYAAAFEQGDISPATMMLDIRTTFITQEGEPYIPLNYDLTFRGPVRMREALASSYNLIAVKVLDSTGIETMTNLARAMGMRSFDDTNHFGLALTLGGGEVSLMELTTAYAVFANGGYAIQPRVVQHVNDSEGNPVWSDSCLDGTGDCRLSQALDPRVAYLITDILSDDFARIPTFGEDSALNLSRPAAVKTGTTTDFRDNWAIGYTPNLLTGVWVGNADNESMKQVTGITGAAPLWHDIMELALSEMPNVDFTRPDGLVQHEVCALSGKLPNPDCPHRMMETFIPGTEPDELCNIHQRTGGQTYLILPAEAQSWAVEHHIPLPPENSSHPTDIPASLAITHPDEGAVYRLDPTVPRDIQKIEVSAAVGGTFERVSLWVNGVPLATLTAPLYAVHWQLEPGEHTFKALGVTDSGAEVWSESVLIEVQR
ncbi:MAG: PBP1A family penicillin-binding protein [Anaerolineae bacterium]|nr:PBP1A family penicillin-binding protein [Anaerolineae bacterium]